MLNSKALHSYFWKGTFFAFFFTALNACSISKYISPEQPLYSGSEINIVNPDQVPNPKDLETKLLAQVQQEKSGTIGNWWWFKLQTEKEKGLKKRLRNLFGHEPAYYREDKSDQATLLMRDYLKDHGYFGAEISRSRQVEDSIHLKDVFTLVSKGRSVMDTVVWPKDSSALGEFLRKQKPATYAKQGTYYSVAALNAERARLDLLTSRNGFYDFSSNNIFYIVDSLAGTNSTNIYMRLDKGSDTLSFQRFHIGNTFVYPNYVVGKQRDTMKFDTSFINEVAVITSSYERLNPEVVERRILLKKGDLYDEQIYRNTVNQLLDLGVFKFVNYEFKKRATDSTPVLDQYIYLTQGQSQSIGVDLEATTRAGSSAAGLGLNAAIRHNNNNLFNGAEDLSISLSAGYGPQNSVVDTAAVVSTVELTGQVELALPRFIAPGFKWLERRALYIPRTVASVNYQLLTRPEFDLQKFGLRLGYRYRTNEFVTHELYPINLAYTVLAKSTPKFDSVLNVQPRLEQSFADNAVAGLEYIFRYSDQNVSNAKDFWAIEAGIKTSGNVASAFAKTPPDGGPKQIAGVQLSQFFRTYVDARRTYLLGKSSFASRAFVGVGLPYGNSQVLPYIDQFFAGGPNSIRAFRLRGLGPGATAPVNFDGQRTTNLDQTGDIRLELNAEYRLDVAPFVETAVFTDIGNVWTVNDISAEVPEGVFDFNTFYKQLAVGVGAGIRLDFDILLIRFDYSAPIRVPWEQGGSTFDFSRFNIFDKATRNAAGGPQFIIAIGYPF